MTIESRAAVRDKAPSCFESEFSRVRRTQEEEVLDRTFSAFEDKVAKSICEAAFTAIQDAKDGRQGRTFRVVSAATGSGKTMSTMAFIAAMYRSDPSFTCAIVQEEIRLCDETYRSLRLLLGADADIEIWTSAHDLKAKPKETMEKYGFVADRPRHPSALKSGRIIVTTHKRWMKEMKSAQDLGVRRCNGSRRSLVFVDEHPQLAKVIVVPPMRIQELIDTLCGNIGESERDHDPRALGFSELHPGVSILRKLRDKMEAVL